MNTWGEEQNDWKESEEEGGREMERHIDKQTSRQRQTAINRGQKIVLILITSNY